MRIILAKEANEIDLETVIGKGDPIGTGSNSKLLHVKDIRVINHVVEKDNLETSKIITTVFKIFDQLHKTLGFVNATPNLPTDIVTKKTPLDLALI